MLKRIFAVLFCVVYAAAAAQTTQKPFIDWENLKNPVYGHPGWSVKDAAMAYGEGWFYLFFSAFYHDCGRERSHVVSVRTRDFRSYSEPLFIWDGMPDGWDGAASPDIVKHGGVYYLTCNTWGDKPGKPNQLFYATSHDMKTWSAWKPLAENLTRGVRAIDAALAFANERVYLVYKEGQSPRIAVADSVGSQAWRPVGVPMDGCWFENAQFLRIDSLRYLLATHRGHEPYLSRMSGGGSRDEDWLRYDPPVKCVVPVEGFNTDESSNAASLYDFRTYDGYFYLLYAGRTENISHAGRGDNRLGIARSRDLIRWETP